MSYKDFHVKNGIVVDTGNQISVGNNTVNTVITAGGISLNGTSISYGYTGSQGVIGYSGSQGFTGSVGAYSAVGFTGSQGDPGNPGGYTGSQGPTGYIGSRGYSGSLGFTGSRGAYDSIGFTGSQGVIGYSGSQSTVIGYTGSQGIIGIGFTWKGAWSASTTYYVNDIVWYNNASYECIAQAYGSGQSPVNGSYWAIMAAQGAQGYTGSLGWVGSQGWDGPTGYTGSIGGIGYSGSLGFVGSVGIPGGYFKGNNGTIGDPSFANNLFQINANTMSANVTIAAGENAMTCGPMNLVGTLTIQTGGRAAIV